MLPLPDAHQSNLAGQPSAGLQQASGGVGLRFRAYATQVLQRSGRGVQRMFLLIAIREGAFARLVAKALHTDWVPRPKAARG